MAPKAGDSSTPITLISLSAARDLVVETLLSAEWAGLQLIKWLHLRRVGWQYEMVLGQPAPNRTLEQEAEALWAQPTRVLVDWQGGCAHRVTVYRKDNAGCLRPVRRVTVIGIRVVREDIERRLAQIPRALLASVTADGQSNPPEPPPEAPQSESAKKWQSKEALRWLVIAMENNPRRSGESKNAWARRLYDDHMKKVFGDDIPWSEWGTLRRRMDS
jgi:hypothetical protein